MDLSQLRFHHLGLAVKRPSAAQKFLAVAGYELGAPVFDPAQNVHLQMGVHASQPAVEIVWPDETPGPLGKLVQAHPAGIIYHVCYETWDLAAALAGLQAAGLNPICISPPKPAPLFAGRHVSFYNLVGIGLIEILEPAPI